MDAANFVSAGAARGGLLCEAPLLLSLLCALLGRSAPLHDGPEPQCASC